MNTWPRFIGCFLLILIWLFFISLPIFAFTLAARQQIQLGSDERSHLRIFLLQEKDAKGIGIELARPFSTNPPCSQTSVRFFMWAVPSKNVTFCQCYDPQTNDNLPAVPGVCNPP
jgi:hypothetical protein